MVGLLLASASAAAAEKPEVLLDRYYEVFMVDQRLGYEHHLTVRKGDRITTELDARMTVAKFKNPIETKVVGREVESADGRPIQASSKVMVGAMVFMSEETAFEGRTARYTQVEMPNKRTVRNYQFEVLPVLEYHAAEQLRKSGMKVGEKVAMLRYMPALFPETGAADFIYEFEAREELTILGMPVTVTRARVICEQNARFNGTGWFDSQGFEVKSTLPSVANAVRVMTTRRQALHPAPTTQPGFFAATFVKLGQSLPDYETMEKLTLLAGGEGAAADLFVETDHQEVTARGKQVFVTVHHAARPRTKTTDEQLAVMLKPSNLVESDNPRIAALAKQITQGAGSAAEKVDAVRRYVWGHMKLSQGAAGLLMDSAAKVLETMSGDCTEYAVLTAAMCRAAGVPARVAMGLVYAPQFMGHKDIFAYHAWTEAWYDGRWNGVDATRPGSFDVTHLAMIVNEGVQPEPADMLRMAGSMGGLKLTVADGPPTTRKSDGQ